jgi:hypothetical protein
MPLRVLSRERRFVKSRRVSKFDLQISEKSFMNEPPQINKRIVSKAEYIQVQGKKVSLAASGSMLALLGMLCICLMICSGICFILCFFDAVYGYEGNYVLGLKGSVVATMLFGCFGYWCEIVGDAASKRSEKIEAVFPLTRANTANLPAPESLLRASVEPVQGQEAVLLRAASQGEERREEHLLKPIE